MKPNILIIGSTGKLGTKLLSFCLKNKITISTISCYSNSKKILYQKEKYKIKNHFILSKSNSNIDFCKHLKKNKFHIIYFLDYGSFSLKYLDIILQNNQNTYISIANKEMIIAGGRFLKKSIETSNNFLVPMDSEHFSLINSNVKKNNIDKIYITASGGPFYFNKKINLDDVPTNKVLSHPKWKMGKNNLIDSSNFVNKILEIFELSYIFDIPLHKIEFLISKEALIHSIILFKDGIVAINCFKNDMIIPLSYPLRNFYDLKSINNSDNIFLNNANLALEKPNDKRFLIFKYLNKLRKFKHSEIIKFMILNNRAQHLYLNNKINYNQIIPYIMKKIETNKNEKDFGNYSSVINFLDNLKKRYDRDI